MIEDMRSAPAEQWTVLQDSGNAYTVSMATQVWIDMPSNPRRRNVKRQSKQGHWNAAQKATGAAFEQLRWVVAGELDGRLYKVDGHVRGYLWDTGGLPPPETVFATVYRCEDIDELKALYSAYDSQTAAETQFDKVTGAYHEHGLRLKSKRLRAGTIVDALHIALRGKQRSSSRSSDGGYNMDLYKAVGFFKDELALLDGVDPQPEPFVTGVIAGALIALAEDPTNIEFFRRLAKNEGSKRCGLNDPIEGVLVHVEGLKKAKAAWVKAHHVKLAGIVLRSLQVWNTGEDGSDEYWRATHVESMDLSDVVIRLQEKRSAVEQEEIAKP